MKKFTTLLMTLLTMVLCFILYPSTANAEDSARTYTCTVNGVERTLTENDRGYIYLKIGDESPFRIALNCKQFGFDVYGSIWTVSNSTDIICWSNYDLMGSDLSLFYLYRPTDEGTDAIVEDVESLIYNEQNFVTGYKTFSGEIYPLLTLDEMKAKLGMLDAPTPSPTTEPSATPEPTVEPSATPEPTSAPTVEPTTEPTVAPTVAPTVVPTVAPTVVPTVEPTAEPTTEPTPVPTKLSIKKKNGYTSLYSGSKLVGKYAIKKGTLTWKSGSKTKKFKSIKDAGFIKKSKNLIFMTKSGKVYTVNSKGKKKLIVKKGAKKFIIKSKYVTKVKITPGSVNVTGK